MQLHQVVLDGEVEKSLGGVLVQLVVPVHVPGGGGDENGVRVVVFVFAVIGQGLCPCLVLCPVCSFCSLTEKGEAVLESASEPEQSVKQCSYKAEQN